MLQGLVHRVILYHPEADVSLLSRAYRFAEEAHRNQKRFSGEPFITHPVAVANILANLQMDLQTLVAGLLHDVVEDTGVTLEEIKAAFGDEVALLVDGVTKLNRLEYRSKEEHQAESLRKMFLAMAQDIRVILIKLADRLHNLRTLKYHNETKQKEIARETLEIYAPLAHRLGIYHLKWELEDLSFRYLEPEKYYELAERVSRTRRKREEYIQAAIQILRRKLAETGIFADIQGRPKHLYSIYNKMTRQNKDLSEIYDVLAVRVVVDSIRDCYAVLGTVHTLWKPIPGRFKDYIAMPKSNMYQSLHTTVIGPQGEPLEIQIRTWEMHRTAEYGIAAHWRYKEGGKTDRDLDQKLAWLRQILEWQRELRDAREFMESLKIDLFSDSVFVFTPKGDVLELPAGSVPIDFAYRVHTEVGHRCVGARVNGRLVPLDYQLKNGDIVEIITSKNAVGPSRDWLNLVKTSQAKNRIRQWFKREQREENISRGREALEREARKHGVDVELLKGEKILQFGRRFNLTTVEDVYAAIGDGTVTAQAVINRIREEARAPKAPSEDARPGRVKTPSQNAESAPGIKVKGMSNLLIRLAHCCNPIPGDPIIGYITRGRGVSIHRVDCRNVALFQRGESNRLVEVSWDGNFQSPFLVKLEVSGMDRAGLLSDVMAILSELKISANWVNARGLKNRQAVIELLLELRSKEQLDLIISRINRVRDIYEVRRTS
ncbi:RelA/SpoT family protein [Desulfofundulus thermocisternus]|uniref:RelA/SpoT family protein n=1 Tax=Desulfofundulus thermocisternus TaxID=42471 RepID=UPI001A015558|nr:bifunctional (p)ppGpp synthetase/guanosine-3',5'-bis(diphosphate) 3'-pyrophosphohydrolase [Desulfofundulus thermocisternus]MBE3584770.1 bifunctional (p)ppGpp synthetase/guanosine-3',5'-bis(diphosphate) 3'-pyrophosphohydrolase [Thermoanaerobacter sp.]MCS5694869.1 bifunctional (p)ppGpp synthetase/guanosine-3',5'-bis(diphosphate) 3'-pyrophosphohydrolase [Desulfofundulus thermocisternus]